MTVRVYRSTDNGAPVLTGLAGSLIAVLDGCLVNGYGAITISSITQSGGVATVTTSAPHNWVNGPKVLVSGATQAGYNLEVTATITGASTFTYPVDPGTVTPATGAPTVKRGASGWTKPFTGTNVASYKQPAGISNGMSLRVDDNTTSNIARVLGYEVMTSVSAGTSPFPTSAQSTGGLYFYKSTPTDATPCAWILVCNGPMFYLFNNANATVGWNDANSFAFGDITSYKSGDVKNTVIIGGIDTSVSPQLPILATAVPTVVTGHYVARSYTQLGSSTTLGKGTDSYKANGATIIGGAGLVYPNPADGGLYAAPVFISEPVAVSMRGVLPGFWNPLHNKPLAHGDVWVPTGDLAGKTLEAINMNPSGQVFVETSDTW